MHQPDTCQPTEWHIKLESWDLKWPFCQFFTWNFAFSFFRQQGFDSCKSCHEILATVKSVETHLSCMVDAHTWNWRSTRFCFSRLHKWHIITSIYARCTTSTMRQKSDTEKQADSHCPHEMQGNTFIYLHELTVADGVRCPKHFFFFFSCAKMM